MKNIILSALFVAMVLTISAPNVMASHHSSKTGSGPTTNTGDNTGGGAGTNSPSGTTSGGTNEIGPRGGLTNGGPPPSPPASGNPPPSGPTTTTPTGTPQTSTPTPTTPKTVFKGPTQIQNCLAAGIVALNQCTAIMNIKNIHDTTVRGTNLIIGAPSTTSSGATPVILFIQGVGYVELTGIQNSGDGQATITYAVLVPAK